MLSGGGARGVAHVGVLKALETLRIPIDCIAGTSMGAVIGGAYASGMTTREMEDVIAGLSTDILLPVRQLDGDAFRPREKHQLAVVEGHGVVAQPHARCSR